MCHVYGVVQGCVLMHWAPKLILHQMLASIPKNLSIIRPCMPRYRESGTARAPH
jgi:hypothetical protein